MRRAGLSPAAIQAVASQLPGWPSLSRDPAGFRARVASLVSLLAGDAALASEALAREPRLLTRVPGALADEAARLRALLGADAGQLARLVAAAPQVLMGLGARGIAQRLDDLRAALLAQGSAPAAAATAAGAARARQRPRRGPAQRQGQREPQHELEQRGAHAGAGGAPAPAPSHLQRSASGAAASHHPCGPLLLREPSLLLLSPALMQQRLAGLHSALQAMADAAGSGAGGPGATGGSGGLAGLAVRLAARRPALLMVQPQALAWRAPELVRLLGPATAATLLRGPCHDALLAPLLLARSDALRRLHTSLAATLPELPPRQVLALLGRGQLHWDQLDYLRHAGVVPAWGAHHPHHLPAADAAGIGDGAAGGSGAAAAAAAQQALHVGRLALVQQPALFAGLHPDFHPWQALRRAAHVAPGEWGWRSEVDRELLGGELAGLLAGMTGRWARLLACRAHILAPNPGGDGAAARQRRSAKQQQQRRQGQGSGAEAAAGAGAGLEADDAPPPFPSLRRVQAMGDAEWAAFSAARLAPGSRVPPLPALPDGEAMPLLACPNAKLQQRLAAYWAAWSALQHEVEGCAAWEAELADWAGLLPAALAGQRHAPAAVRRAPAGAGAGAGGGSGGAPGGARMPGATTAGAQVAAWWGGHLLAEDARERLIQRLRFLRRAAPTGAGGAGPPAGLWRALAASDAAFAADHPDYATWAAVAALARGRPGWEEELHHSPDLAGSALAAWLRGAAGAGLPRLQFLALAEGGDAWRACGLVEAVGMGEDAFADLFPHYRYGAWRLLLDAPPGGAGTPAPAPRGGAAGSASAVSGQAGAAAAGKTGVAAGAAAAAAAGPSSAGLPAAAQALAAAAGARPTRRSAKLLGSVSAVMEVAERCEAWREEAQRWDEAAWRRVLRGIKVAGAHSRAGFALAAGRGGGGAGPPPLASVLTMHPRAFEASQPLYPMWAALQAALAGVPAWQAELGSWGAQQLEGALRAALEVAESTVGGAPGGAAGGGGAPTGEGSSGGAEEGAAAPAPDAPAEAHAAGGAAQATGADGAGAAPAPRRAGAWPPPQSDPCCQEVLRRVRFLTARRRWHTYGGLAEALAHPRAGFAARWPQYDPDEVERQQAAALEREAAEVAAAEAAWVGPQHLAPGTLDALNPRARAAAEGGRLAELQRLAHSSPEYWEGAFRAYKPRTLEQLLLAPGERIERIRYAAA